MARTPPNGRCHSVDIYRMRHAHRVLPSPARPTAEGRGDHFTGPTVYVPLSALPFSAQAPPSEENLFGPPPTYRQHPTAAMLPANQARHQAKVFVMPTDAMDNQLEDSDFESVTSSRAGWPIPAHKSTISTQLTIPAQLKILAQPAVRACIIPRKGGLASPHRTRSGRIKRETSHTTGGTATQLATQETVAQETTPPVPLPIDKVKAVLHNLYHL